MDNVPAQLCFNNKAVPGNFDSANSNFHPDQPLGEAEIIALEESAGEVAIKTNGEVKPCGINGVDMERGRPCDFALDREVPQVCQTE